MDFDVVVLGLLTPVRRGRRCALHPYIMGDVVVTWFCPIRPIGDQVPSKRPRRQVFLRGREDDVVHDDDGHHNEPDGDDDDVRDEEDTTINCWRRLGGEGTTTAR